MKLSISFVAVLFGFGSPICGRPQEKQPEDSGDSSLEYEISSAPGDGGAVPGGSSATTVVPTDVDLIDTNAPTDGRLASIKILQPIRLLQATAAMQSKTATLKISTNSHLVSSPPRFLQLESSMISFSKSHPPATTPI